MSGFITVQREMIDHPLFKGQPQRAYAWLWLLSKAAWKRTPFDIKGVIVTLERGQVCTSRHQLAAEWGMSPSAVERFLTRLKTEQMIEQDTGQGRSIITICNYDKYQHEKKEAGQAGGQVTGQGPDKDRTTKEQVNNSLPYGRGADAPTAIDLKAMVFASGRQILKASGHSDREAGSIVGRMRKTYSDAVILDVLARCEAERPEVPLEWIQAALSRTRADGAAPRQGSFFNNNRGSERPFYEVVAERSKTGATA